MNVGVVTEIKTDEHRVALTPAGAGELVRRGHSVLVQAGAGEGSAFPDGDYEQAGARILPGAEDVFGGADLLLKVKEPLAPEVAMLRRGQVLFTYLHLAPAPELTTGLMESGATCVAYETVATDDGQLPLLRPMSEVAGRMATQAGAYHLGKKGGGRGVLMGGVPGVAPAEVVIIGGGVVGTQAAIIATGMEAEVTVFDKSVDRLRVLDNILNGHGRLLYSTALAVEQAVLSADLVIGAVLLPGARAPRVVTREMVAAMRDGAVLVDVSVDQGGCFETTRPTTHSDPIYEVDGVVHYCVANMPGAFPVTSTMALTNATLPYVEAIADRGVETACRADRALARGVNIIGGDCVYRQVADATGVEYAPLERHWPGITV